MHYVTMDYQTLYNACRRMGSPEFQSTQEMIDWIRGRFADADGFIALNTVLPVWELIRDIGTDEFRYLRRLLLGIVGRLLRLKLQSSYRFKALHSPLRMFPKTLHPIDAAA